MRKIGIIEDDKKLSSELCMFLKNNGYDAVSLSEEQFNLDSVLESRLDLLLLDIGLPNTDGQFLCREIRKVSELPIIMITSNNSEITELTSMTYGADDFITKPFNTQILLLRMEALLKRAYKEAGTGEILDAGEFSLDTSRSIAYSKAGEIELTKNEFKILYCLVKHKSMVVSRDEIITFLWDSEMFVDDNTLTVNITRLRGKLEKIDVKNVIQTKRGQGYVLVCGL